MRNLNCPGLGEEKFVQSCPLLIQVLVFNFDTPALGQVMRGFKY